MTIEITNLEFKYPSGDFALSVPDFQIPSGQSLALVGPSGCGKTTFLNLLSALLTPHRGDIVVNQQSLVALTDTDKRTYRAQQTGYVFQDFGLVEYLSAKENLLYPYLITSQRRPNDLSLRIDELTNGFGIAHVLHKKPAQISQGEKQRVAICRAILTKPKIILADEPTGNLDPDNKGVILDHLFGQVDETGATLIVVTHDTGLADRFDRVLDFAQFGKRTA